MFVFGKVNAFGQEWLFSGKCGCTLARLSVLGKSDCIWAKMIVFGQKKLYSGKSGFIRTKWFYS